MRRRNFLAFGVVAALAVALASSGPGSKRAAVAAVPDAAITMPPDYRDWRLFSVAREEGTLQDIRAIVGNDVAIAAARTGSRPFPEGSVLARIAWTYVALPESQRAFGQLQSFVAGQPKNGVQFMVKDSRRFASTGGWGYAQFTDGKRDTVEAASTCFACHSIVKARDFVFTHYAR